MNAKRIATQFWKENEIKIASNPEDYNGDEIHTTCEVTGERGDCEPMVFVDSNDEMFELDVLVAVAYALHGLAGAY